MKTKSLTIAVGLTLAVFSVSGQTTVPSNTLSGSLPSSPAQFLGSSNAADVIFRAAGTEYMRILGGTSSVGNIGIGTSTPISKFNVHNIALRLTGFVPGFGGPMVLFGGSTSSAPNGEWGLEYDTGTPGKEGLNFWRPFGCTGLAGNNFLYVGNTGRVGVNTNNATAQLTVNGNMIVGDPTMNLPTGYKLYVETGILTEKVKVAVKNSANWADYVFASAYKLKPLNEVELFVKANKHLPGIPSADEVVQQGVDLGVMNAKLLEKVEELTLYLIEQNKKIEHLEFELSKIKK